MAFPSTGINHRDGIKNEHKLTKQFNDGLIAEMFSIPNLTAEHRGGTTEKADVVLIDSNTKEVVKRISAKEKKKETTGTYDYSNSTSYITYCAENNLPFVTHLREFMTYAKELRASGNISSAQKSECRTLCKQAVEKTLNSLTSSDIREIIDSVLITPNLGMDYVITIVNTKQMYHFEFTSHPIVKLINDSNTIFFLEKKSSKEYCESRTLMAKVGNDMIDTGIRIRLHLNNGISALLGMSTTNKSSSFCIKFQQDNFESIKEISKVYG